MTEVSRPWPREPEVGDWGPYTDDDWDDIWEALFGSGRTPFESRGVIADCENELIVSSTGNNNARVAIGAALVHGKFYENTANVDLYINTSVGAWREDLVCLRSDWAAQTVRAYVHENPADGAVYPNPTQIDGTTWEIPLAAVRINNAGAITQITDLREYIAGWTGILDASPDADLTANGLKTVIIVGESVAFGNALYMKNDGKLWKADADQDTTAPAIAMALETKDADKTCMVLLYGFARDDSWNWTVGADLFLSCTAGGITETAPNGAGDQIQIVGIATHADRMFFDPQLEMVEHV